MSRLDETVSNRSMRLHEPRRRRLRFGLTTLALAVAMIGAALGWWTSRTQTQKRAVEAILGMGGQVSYDYSWDVDGKLKKRSDRKSDWPRWLLDQVGVDGLHDVVGVSIIGAQVSHQDFVHLAKLAKLKRFEVAHAKLSGQGFSHLAGLRHLNYLYIYDSPIQDMALAHLGRLESLEEAYLLDTQITDGGLEHLGRLRNLKLLQIGGPNLTRDGVDALQRRLPDCQIQMAGYNQN